VGTCGWNYDSWRENFYGDTPKKNWLRFCAERFNSIEVNATFYRLQTREIFARWRKETPRDFRFAIKANRYLTHNKKLKDPLPAIRLERDRAAGLGNKLAVVVWQLPHNFKTSLERLETFARALNAWRKVRHAIEFRHESWFDDEVLNCLKDHRIAICQSDASDWPMWDAVSTDLVYIRLHGHTRTYISRYGMKGLASWTKRIRRWLREGRDVHCYFDNDTLGVAPEDAALLVRACQGRWRNKRE